MVYSVQEYKFGLGPQEDALCMILTKSHINSQSKLHSALQVLSLSCEDDLEEGMTTHSSGLSLENSMDRGDW